MARAFSIETAQSRFNFSRLTRERIKGLILDLDMDATGVVELAIAQLWQREIGEPDRDVLAELDDLKASIEQLKAAQRQGEGT